MVARGWTKYEVVYPLSPEDPAPTALGAVSALFFEKSRVRPNLVELPLEVDGRRLCAGMLLRGTADFDAEIGSDVDPQKLSILEIPEE
jgi:hypothetical protein